MKVSWACLIMGARNCGSNLRRLYLFQLLLNTSSRSEVGSCSVMLELALHQQKTCRFTGRLLGWICSESKSELRFVGYTARCRLHPARHLTSAVLIGVGVAPFERFDECTVVPRERVSRCNPVELLDLFQG